ncbi:MAG TPA: ferredoxin:thioredoxin reductase [Candidatus Portnoybacteria bacterium]|nr:ferredoxin:thioredoxin reductase [Candidatus Portnoybacteria bacterium]
MSSLEEKKAKFEKILQESQKYAQENGICLNPDKKIVKFLINSLIEKEEKYGRRYCPCRRVTDDEEKNKKIICPCSYCLDEVERDGHCHCFLFVDCGKIHPKLD